MSVTKQMSAPFIAIVGKINTVNYPCKSFRTVFSSVYANNDLSFMIKKTESASIYKIFIYTLSLSGYFSTLQQTSNISATLVLARPIKGPKTIVLDLEMVTVNNVINFRGSSIIRLTIFVPEHPFWDVNLRPLWPLTPSYLHHGLLLLHYPSSSCISSSFVSVVPDFCVVISLSVS